ncbi:MAG: acyltransferase domain-containing protein [Caldilineaceae bacterium]
MLAEQFAAEGVKVRKLTVSHAFHSPLMEPMLEDFRRVAQGITYHAPKLRLISNLTGKEAGAEVATPEYWVRHVRQAVRFADGVATLQELNIPVWLEIGPKPVLLGMAQSLVESAPRPPLLLRSLHHKHSDWQALLSSLGELYVRGAVIDWPRFDQDYVRRKVALPTYPFQRKHFWVTDEQSPKRDRLTEGVAPSTQSTDRLDAAIPLPNRSATFQSALVENGITLVPQTTELDAEVDDGSRASPNDEFQALDQPDSDGLILEIAEVKGFHFSIQLGGEQT